MELDMLILYPLIWGPGRIGNAALLRAVKKAFGEVGRGREVSLMVCCAMLTFPC